MEIPLGYRRYTWTNKRQDPSMAKLDRMLVSDDWEDKFALCSIMSLQRPMSDHIYVVL